MESVFASSRLSWPSKSPSSQTSNGDLSFIKNSSPIYSRDLIKDLEGIWSTFVEQNGELSTDINATPIYNLQVTYTISQYKVSTLKNWITRNNGKKKKPIRLSTFEVTCAYIWVCLIKLKEAKISEIIANEDNDDDDDVIQHFIFHVECRNRLRVPQGYFGNCLQPCITAAKRNEQLAENGVIMAANAIGETVMELEKEVMKEAETWVSRLWGILKNSKHFVS
ncbi:hypothetical protein V6N13_106833 [Hibiscus sabdariffa]